ncbi:hypothetical protein BD410DRAFT_802782 [Rickenella mellea]|uniref:DUF6533 domain-containing protein n=1 Tax=Rickenella mellea TaxID=50990 RepID=A0A4Y7Q8E2_9AGAM|nr:hypothetical protein BD410DRAFT_802782 [Rickenella mellea]
MENSFLAADPFVFNVIDQILSNRHFSNLKTVTYSTAILYYDHILMLPEEIQHIWRQKLSPVSVIYLLNRYLTFFGYIPILFFMFNSPHDDHRKVAYPPVYKTLTEPDSRFQMLVILIVRVYALYYREIWVLVLTGILGASTVAASVDLLTCGFLIEITSVVLFRQNVTHADGRSLQGLMVTDHGLRCYDNFIDAVPDLPNVSSS